VYVQDYDKFEIMGKTRDDAAGEAFDKVARAVGLGYPGGPIIDKTAKLGNSKAIDFPRVHFGDQSLDFSFSGLKTAVLNYINSMEQKGEKYSVEDVCASFQAAVVDVLTDNLISAARIKGVKKWLWPAEWLQIPFCAASLWKRPKDLAWKYFIQSRYLCTDNAAMIACAAYYEFLRGHTSDVVFKCHTRIKVG